MGQSSTSDHYEKKYNETQEELKQVKAKLSTMEYWTNIVASMHPELAPQSQSTQPGETSHQHPNPNDTFPF